MSELTVDTTSFDNGATYMIEVEGKITHKSRTKFEASFQKLPASVKNLNLDLTKAVHLDSTGIASMLKMLDLRDERDLAVKFIVKNGSFIHKMLKLANFEEIVDIEVK